MATVPTGLTIRSAEDADWRAMSLLDAACFGVAESPHAQSMWRTMVPVDGALIACDGPDVVGMALYLDLQLTVPGGAVLPAAGVSGVAVAPTHRRRGMLREMFTELHHRIALARYPIAALTASEAGIYGQFGYGPATVEHALTVERRTARFRSEVPDPGGVRVVRPPESRVEIEEIYERWRRRTPAGLHTPQPMWDEVFEDRDDARHGGTAMFALLHADGFALYRVHSEQKGKSARITKFAAITPQAHAALWRVLLGLDLLDTVDVSTYPGDPLPYLLTDARLVRTTSSADELWLRLTDVPAALRARRYAADLSVVLDLADGVLGGGGRFLLTVRDGRAECVPTGAAADVRTDLSVLGSLYLGAHRASAFAAANRLRCEDDSTIRRLDAAMASEVPAQLGYGF